MKGIKLVRIDFRLIHGQVITKWKNIIQTTDIIIIDDLLVSDEFMRDIYEMAAPPGVTVKTVSVEDFVNMSKTDALDKGNILVLLKSVETLQKLFDADVKFPEVQVGGLGGGSGRKQIVTGITISPEELETLKQLSEKGISIYFQVTPEEKKTKLN